ncbi:MAG: NERD domain-containing protein, partial [Gammaproteobacteria bacterium]
MNTHTTVEVSLGHSITVASENQFLARLRRDLLKRGLSARILANLHVGRDARQVDFVVITEYRVVQIEQKTFPGPIVDGPKNGPWKVRVGANDVRERGNPLLQALDATYALSDELHAFADCGRAPSPRAGKFYREIDTIVCGFPVLPNGSRFDQHPHVNVFGYDALIDRLQRPGPRIPWSDADWDAFGQHLNLYRADDELPEGIVQRAGTAAVDAYLGHYLQAQEELPTLVPTAVAVDTLPAPRPDLADELARGRAVLLHGPSELGKTVWARTAAAELARSGHVPIWLAADVCESSFRTSMA